MRNQTMKNTFTIIVTIIIGASQMANAQTINGTIRDENANPVPFANVILLKGDSTFVTGAVSSDDGHFAVERKAGAQLIKITSVGYESFCRQIADIQDFDNIVINSQTTELNEVTVKAAQIITQLKGTSLVTNVAGTILSSKTSTMRMLGQIPGLCPAAGGTVTVLGKGAPIYYINNRKVSDPRELDELLPENIKDVEVIASPGAKYPSGTGAVVRINTVKLTGEGFGFYGRHYAAANSKNLITDNLLNIKYRKKNLDLFVSGRYLYDDHITDMESETLNNSNHKWVTKSVISEDYEHDYVPLSVGFNYQINNNHSLGAKATGAFSTLNRKRFENTLTSYCDDAEYDKLDLKKNVEYQYRPNLNDMNAYYSGKIGDLTIDFNTDYVSTKTKEKSNCNELSADYDDRDIVTENDRRSTLLAHKIVFGHPLGGGKIEFGGETVFTEYTDNMSSQSQEFVPSSESHSEQKDIAAFIEYQRNISKMTLNAGLRYEYVDYDFFHNNIRNENASCVNNQLSPTLSVSGELGPVRMSLTYSDRIRRPSYGSMGNYLNYISRYSYSKGNPDIKPSFSHEFALSSAYKFFQAGATYTLTIDDFKSFSIVNPDSPESVVRTSFNIGTTSKLMLFFSTQPSFGIYRPSLNLNCGLQWLEVESQGVTEKLHKPAFWGSFANRFVLESGWNFEMNIFFQSNGHSGYNLQKRIVRADANINKSFFKNALRVEVGLDDIFHSYIAKNKEYSESGFDDTRFDYNQHMINATIIYNINPSQNKYKGTGAGNAEKSRL